MEREIVRGYADAAHELISRYEAVSSTELYSHVAEFLPQGPDHVIDIGAGTGRDAAWFASTGCHVLAVEPVAEFREAGATLHPSPRIEWLDDSLPLLARTMQRAEAFDFVLLNAVWQHLDARQRRSAIPNLKTLTAQTGRLLISMRHGPGAPSRPCHPARAEDAIDLAQDSGFELVFICSTGSIQAQNRPAAVTWTWLVFSSA